MIDLLLQAERSLSVGLADEAELLYRRVLASDPANSIAVVGLARVALERADDRGAYQQARRALAIDPENVAAQRLVTRLEEVFAHRGEPVPAVEQGAGELGAQAPPPAVAPASPPAVAPPRRGLLRRLIDRR